MIEKGSDLEQRACPMIESSIPCVQCSLCSILCGWGGAGAYSDGKLTLTSDFGGWLKDYLSAEIWNRSLSMSILFTSRSAQGKRSRRGQCGPVPSQKEGGGIQPRAHSRADQAYRHGPLQGSPEKYQGRLDGKVDVLFDTPVADQCR